MLYQSFNKKYFSNVIKPIKLSYSITNQETFNPENKYCVFLHGLFGNKNNFRGFSYSEKIKSKRNPIIVDLRNHGLSEHSNTMSYQEMAHDLHNLIIQEIKLSPDKKFTLLGHSMGGKVAMAYACLFPNTIDGLFIMDSRPISNCDDNTVSSVVLKTVKKVANINLTNRTRNDVLQELYKEVGGTITNLLNTNLLSEPELKWRVNVKAIEAEINNILGWKDIGVYNGNVRILNGEKSTRFSIDDFKKTFPNIKMRDIRIIQGAGHWVHADKPQETLEEISKFLIELDNQIRV